MRKDIYSTKWLFNLAGWIVALAATAVYMLTLEPSVSFWDCGEFIATSHKLQIGHPPGAPVYQLLAHCFMLFAGNDATMLAWWSNALSAVSGGITAMFLFWTIARLIKAFNGRHILIPAAIGAACYVFCDTAWFSAVESEVYSLAMLFASAIIWAMVRWSQSGNPRWILLSALLMGLSAGVHLLCLLTIPAVVLIILLFRTESQKAALSTVAFSAAFFVIGLTPYLIIPIRAAANPPINMGDPSTAAAFKSYLGRDQYEKAPLLYGRCFNSPIIAYENGKPVYAKEMDMFFPRMWKRHPHAEQYYTDWCGYHGKMVDVAGNKYYKPSFGDNLVIFGGYQIGYMYLRYLMWNFAGRYNDRQGFGNLQKGQFITGLPHLDRLYVGTSSALPPSMPSDGHNRYFMLPLLLAFVGIAAHARRHRKGFWVVFTLFITSSLLLAVYLNHPMYEPRERDYAYILSFYAFAVWIGIGAFAILDRRFRRLGEKENGRYGVIVKSILLLCVPMLMAFQNWDDHDRSGRFIARDSAANLLNSCDEGSLLFTLGDNDTYPLWYMQEVENYRTDVHVINISLLGSDSYALSVIRDLDDGDLGWNEESLASMGPFRRMMSLLTWSNGRRPVYFTHYAKDDVRVSFDGRLQLSGIAYRLGDTLSADSVDVERSCRLMASKLQWHSLQGVYIDETSHTFLKQYWDDAILTAKNLASHGAPQKGVEVLDHTLRQIPLSLMYNPTLTLEASLAYAACGDERQADQLMQQARHDAGEQLEYYYTMSPKMRSYIPYSLEPLQLIQEL